MKDTCMKRIDAGVRTFAGGTSQSVAGWSQLAACVLLLGVTCGAAVEAVAGAFIFAGEANGVDVITHPTGYTGAGGVLNVTVCVDPTSANATDMEIPVQNAVATWNALAPVNPNLFFGASNNVPATDVDWESAVLHELGHCIGLAHPNLATESGLTGTDREYTKSTDGANDAFDLDDGADDVNGSADDGRGDDVNLHYFRIANNNPFTIDATVDSTTYSRAVANLPAGDTFATNAERTVGALLGFPDTEAVMQQGQNADEAQRQLNHDDVATLRYGMSGLDETVGGGDDYTLTLTYAGLTTACDIVIDFDNAETGFAVCNARGTSLGGGHFRITSANIFFNDGASWFFNTEADLVIQKTDDPDPVTAGKQLVYGIQVTNDGPGTAVDVVVTDVLPAGVTYVSDTDSCIEGPPGTLTCDLGDIAAGDSVTFDITVQVEPGLVVPPALSSTITNTASVASPTRDPDGGDNSVTIDTEVLARLNHFLCYEVRLRPPFRGPAGVLLEDQFGSTTVDIRRRKRLCNPVDKNGEDPTAALDPDHLVSYELRQRDPRFVPLRDVLVINQFGELVVDVIRPHRLLVPTAKDPDALPPPLIDPLVDHFKCYTVARARTRRSGLELTDQFGSLIADVRRPSSLCVPVDKNEEGVIDESAHLMCYEVETTPPRLRSGERFFVDNQFEQGFVVITGPRELCVPSQKVLSEIPPTPTPVPSALATATPTPFATGTPIPEGPRETETPIVETTPTQTATVTSTPTETPGSATATLTPEPSATTTPD